MTPVPAKSSSRTNTRDLILLLAIPLGLLLLAAAYAYLPKILANPTHDFVFSSCVNGWCDNSYRVTPDKGVITLPVIQPIKDNSNARLYYYDVRADSTREITPEEASAFDLDTSSRSPDGYVLEHDQGNGSVFLFFSSDEDSGWHLQNGWLKKPVTFPESTRYGYNGDIQFLGWVK